MYNFSAKGFKLRSLVNVIFFRMLRTTVYSTVALTFCAWIIQSSRYLNILNTTNIGLTKFLRFTSYLSVDIIAIVLPISLAVSAAFVYQRFKENNQLIALQAVGLSPRVIFTPLAMLMAIVVSYLYVSNFYISPLAWRAFRTLEFEIKHNVEPPKHAGVIFLSGNLSIYAQQYVGNCDFENIIIIDSRSPNKCSTYSARVGSIKNNVIYLTKGERTEVDFHTKQSSVMSFSAYNCDLKQVMPSADHVQQPNEKFVRGLLKDDVSPKQRCAQIALLHQKMTSPLWAIVFSQFAFWLIALSPFSRKPSHRYMAELIFIITLLQGVYFWIVNTAAKNPCFSLFNYGLTLSMLLISSILVLRKPRVK